jgi:hypothetical protein
LPKDNFSQNNCGCFKIKYSIPVQSVDTNYTDEGSKTYFYKNLGAGNWNNANATCQDLGGHLPVVLLAGKHSFLMR